MSSYFKYREAMYGSNGHNGVGAYTPWAPVRPTMGGCSACGEDLTHEGEHGTSNPAENPASPYYNAQQGSGMVVPLLLGLGVVALFFFMK
jgi:hypothetical protein